jgi:lambda repressor-like predicted transcriptional regulator
METLRVALANWTDFDASAHVLAQCLGIMPPELWPEVGDGLKG